MGGLGRCRVSRKLVRVERWRDWGVGHVASFRG